jgi:hypothetical protein
MRRHWPRGFRASRHQWRMTSHMEAIAAPLPACQAECLKGRGWGELAKRDQPAWPPPQ